MAIENENPFHPPPTPHHDTLFSARTNQTNEISDEKKIALSVKFQS